MACAYREPKPTKKDKTQTDILATVRRIDAKVDHILEKSPESLRQVQSLLSQLPGRPESRKQCASLENFGQRRSDYFSESHDLRGALSVFPWPSIQSMLRKADGSLGDDLEQLMSCGSAWLVRQEIQADSDPIPPDTLLRSSTFYVPTEPDGPPRSMFPDLTVDLMDFYTSAYFGSFNMVYPVLDREDFVTSILPTMKTHGFAIGCLKSVIALLVFALGRTAYEGTNGGPIAEGSGIRGGTRKKPPALEIFNEARRRMGFVMSSLSLENTQAMLLTAVFYESCYRHTDFWRMSVTAFDGLRAVLRLESEWDVDMVRRTFWTCSLIESWYYFDLNLPRTDGENLHDAIALPDFGHRKDFEGQPSIESKYQYNFLSMLSLRALMHRTFEELHDHEGRREGEKAHQKIIISELSHQLNTWRTLLPQDLAWDDDTRLDCNVERDAADVPPLLHVDILLAQLRCRYYYARFMIHRPFVWKVLHETSASLSQSPDILEGFIVAVDSMMHWPIAFPSVRDKKRLVPNNFVWTQSFLMFLLILRVVRDSDDVWQFCKKRVGAKRIEESVDVMLDWIGDLRMVDGMARWAWRILTPIYGLAE